MKNKIDVLTYSCTLFFCVYCLFSFVSKGELILFAFIVAETGAGFLYFWFELHYDDFEKWIFGKMELDKFILEVNK